MLHHVSVGVADVERAVRFYDPVLATLGYKRVMEFMPYAVAYGEDAPVFWVQLPHDQQPASVGNGVHIGFSAATREAVHAFHAAALSAGGTDNGGPGPREMYGPDYYGAFVIDLDGNRLEATLHPVPAKSRSAAGSGTKATAKRGTAAKRNKKRAKKKPAARTPKKKARRK